MILLLTPTLFALWLFLATKRITQIALLGLSLQLFFTLFFIFTVTLPFVVSLGEWGAPLGIELRITSLSLLFCLLTSIVMLAVGVYARTYYHANQKEQKRFYILLFFLGLGLNLLFISDDLFNIYVALEITGLSAVGLSALRSDKEALRASLLYLFATLIGSGAYLLGVVLFYGQHGVLSLSMLSTLHQGTGTEAVAMGLMTTGLALKTALFPLHFWLPKAHANATSPVSALLSALVIKGSFYVLYRLWFDGGFGAETLGHALGIIGGIAVLYASVLALLQTRLKRIIAYSTVAQVGYLFLVFGLVKFDDSVVPQGGIILLALSHGLAKAAMFLTAGTLVFAFKKDELHALGGIVAYAPLSVFSFGIAAISIMGLPPSLGFFAKWLLLLSAIENGEFAVAGVFIAGGVLSAAYVFRVMMVFMGRNYQSNSSVTTPSSWLELPTLFLALSSLILGFFVSPLLEFLHGA